MERCMYIDVYVHTYSRNAAKCILYISENLMPESPLLHMYIIYIIL